jgi:hypothetical protein
MDRMLDRLVKHLEETDQMLVVLALQVSEAMASRLNEQWEKNENLIKEARGE